MGRRPGVSAEADPPRRGRRRDSEVTIGQDPAPRAEGPRGGGDLVPHLTNPRSGETMAMNGKLIATLCVAAATFVIAACGDDGGNGDAEENGGAEEISAAAPDPTELEGTWSTEPVTAADLAETVRAAGLGEHVE